MRGVAALFRLVNLRIEMRLCEVRRRERTNVRDQAATSETHFYADFTSPPPENACNGKWATYSRSVFLTKHSL